MDHKAWPRVTVFTLIFNTGKFVIQAIESVKANNYPNLQHIIIDDCSTDNTSPQLVEQWIKDHAYPCTFIRHDVNRGICKTLNEVFEMAEGKYILGVNDDLLDRDRIKNHVEYFETRPLSTAAVFSDVRLINEQNEVVAESYLQKRNFIPQYSSTYYNLLEDCYIPAPGATMRVESVRAVGLFDESIYMEDWDMWLRLSRTYSLEQVAGRAGSYRVRTGSVTNAPSARFYEGCIKSLLKNVSDATSIKIATPKLLNFAELNYRNSGRNVSLLFFKIFMVSRSFKALSMSVISAVCSYNFFERVLKVKQRLLRMFA